ncbi:MAG: rRNA (cytosine1402-N4)-methyltransferase [Bacteroidota bacterium]|nr:rRNA (cytosine1402-N4)-methyltransferase [Bacteroidota bacterium]
MIDYHEPALLREAVDLLVNGTDETYIDGTIGGGGHSAEILARLGSAGKLFGFDRDIAALERCAERFGEELSKGSDSRLKLYNQPYFSACSIENIGGVKAKGLLLDLGISSRQIDSDNRGFSYRSNSPLDMRFGEQALTAEVLLNESKEEKLVQILRLFGEVPQAEKIARRIVERRRARPLHTSFDLRSAVEEATPAGRSLRVLSQVFQAFRIAVNEELDTLKDTITGIIPNLDTGGRIVIISYHSLEDRIVKNLFRQFSQKDFKEQQIDFDIAITMPALRILTKKPLIPTDEERRRNPRSRSAKLRAAERV